MRQKRNSGQILLIAAFIMASLLLSAQLYIFEVGKITYETESNSLNDFVLAIKLGSRHVVTGSLANISDGGQVGNLASNLQKWASLVSRQYQLGKNILNYTLGETAPYVSGVWIDWGANGYGFSSAYANFTYRLSDREIDVTHSYDTNVTTTLFVGSSYQTMSGDVKQVNITISLSNEATPALAEQITIYYRLLDSWQVPDETSNFTVLDYGNGTYLASFVADIPSSNVEISTHVVDQREIYVRANATSTQV